MTHGSKEQASSVNEFNLMGDMALALQKAASKVVRKAAFDIQAETQTNHPWENRTGFTQSSVYVVTHDTSTYGQGIEGQGEMLPEIEHPDSPTEADVAVGAAHFQFLELGTSRMPAMPALVPAAEKVRPQFTEAMRRLEETMALELGL